ncbi:MAG: GumC family protein, partial [Chthoniobacterales bacterium]
MSAPGNWEIEQPGAVTVEALGILQAVRFVVGNIFLLIGGLLVGIAIGLVLQKTTPTAYEANGKFVVDELPFSKQGSGTLDNETQRQLVQTLILSIASRDMSVAVAEQLGIRKDRLAFEGIDIPRKYKSAEPVANIEVTATKDSRIGVVTATSQSPQFAADVVNAILDELKLYNQIGGRLKQISFDRNLDRTKADSILSQIVAVSEKRITLDQQNAELAVYTRQGLPLESFTAFSTDTTLNNLKTQLILVTSEYESIAATNTIGPRLAGKKSELDGLKTQIASHAHSLAGAMKSEFEILTTRQHNLQSELDKTQAHIQSLNDAAARLVQSYGEPAAMRQMIKESSGPANNAGNVVVVIDHGTPRDKPAQPKLALNLAIGLVLGCMLSFGTAALRTMLDNRLHTPEAVAQKTNQRCLALLPPLDPVEKKDSIFDRPRSPIGMGYLRSHFLRTAMDGNQRKIIGFTPSHRNGDASRLVAGLAILLAQADRRTLVIDLHRKPPRIASMLGVKNGDGLGKWLTTDEPLLNCIGYTAIRELAVIGFGDKTTQDLDDLLSRRPIAMELPALLADWDFILIVSPAIRFDWTMMLALPSGSPLVIASDYSNAKAVDVLHTVQRAQTTRWVAEGVVLQN